MTLSKELCEQHQSDVRKILTQKGEQDMANSRNVYKVYTQDLERSVIEVIVNREFPAFTIYQGVGYWKNEQEKTLIIEVVSSVDASNHADDAREERRKILRICEEIRHFNSQESVMLVTSYGSQEFI